MSDAERAALVELAQATARDILAGAIDARAGATRIHDEVVKPFKHPGSLLAWCNLESGYVADAAFKTGLRKVDGADLADEIRREAARLSTRDPADLLAEVATGKLRRAVREFLFAPLAHAHTAYRATRARIAAAHRSEGRSGVRPAGRRVALRILSLTLSTVGTSAWIAAVLGAPVLFSVAPGGTVHLIAIVVFVGAVLRALGRRIGAATAAEAIVAAAGRAPVVYLRSFSVDAANENAGGSSGLVGAREEETLSSIFRFAGPFVAVGNPDDVLPHAGAARAYIGGDDWQGEVASLMDRASLVLLRVSDSPGFVWEESRALRNVPRDRLLFYFSQHLDDAALQATYASFAERARSAVDVELPPAIDHERFLAFDASGKPVLFGRMDRAAPVTMWPIVPTAVLVGFAELRWRRKLRAALRPFFEQRGVLRTGRILFGDVAIGLGACTGGPPTAAAMMAHDARAVGRRAVAYTVLLLALPVALAELWILDRTAQWLTAAFEGARTFQLLLPPYLFVLSFLAAAAILVGLWRAFGGRAIRRHLALGGRRMRWWWSVPLLAIGAWLWWSAVARFVGFAPLVIP